mmetsp:Transcript_111223/g.321568  ORF Transcript_111223/g.321568 Transcript_111223/m.321568 type:complete len:199 (-) Transcript_111223:59-655(-)
MFEGTAPASRRHRVNNTDETPRSMIGDSDDDPWDYTMSVGRSEVMQPRVSSRPNVIPSLNLHNMVPPTSADQGCRAKPAEILALAETPASAVGAPTTSKWLFAACEPAEAHGELEQTAAPSMAYAHATYQPHARKSDGRSCAKWRSCEVSGFCDEDEETLGTIHESEHFAKSNAHRHGHHIGARGSRKNERKDPRWRV